jgi:hypothetical protein
MTWTMAINTLITVAVGIAIGLFVDTKWIFSCILAALIWIAWELHAIGLVAGFGRGQFGRALQAEGRDMADEPLAVRVVIVPSESEGEESDFETFGQEHPYGAG